MFLRLLSILVFIHFSFPLAAQQTSCDSIIWLEHRPLTWNDFRATPDTNSKIGSLSQNSILYRLKPDKTGLTFYAFTYFEPCRSWFKPLDSTLSLDHEQTHFNIDEYIRRSFVHQVLRLERNESFFLFVKHEYLLAMVARRMLHYQYDLETDYHRNKNQQVKWDRKIAGFLQQLDSLQAIEYQLEF